MVVQRTLSAAGQLRVELLDASGKPVPIVTSFLSHLAARDYSPNTLIAYAHDLQHFWQFLTEQGLDWITFYPCDALSLLEYLRRTPMSVTEVVATALTVYQIKRLHHMFTKHDATSYKRKCDWFYNSKSWCDCLEF